MNRLFFFITLFAFGITEGKAQDLSISNNTSCAVYFRVYTDAGGTCMTGCKSVFYNIPANTTVNFSMYTGGTYTQLSYVSGCINPAPGSQWLVFYGGDGTSGASDFNPCLGGFVSTPYTESCSGNTNNMTVTWGTPLTTVVYQ